MTPNPAMQVYPFYHTQVSRLLTDEVFIEVLSKYLNYIDIFSFDLVIEILENTSMNEYIIKLIKSKQLFYRSIYSLESVKLEVLKTYITTYLKIKFIQSSKSFIDIPIFFNQKPDRSLYFCLNY